MVFFHGFGQNSKAFEPIFEALNGEFSFLAINIFFHGNSQLEENLPLSVNEWSNLISELFKKLEIEKADAIGFSMGCKFALVATQSLPKLFSGLYLLAPDGVIMNPWYNFGARTATGRFCMKLFIGYIPTIRFLVLILSKMGILRPSLGRFAIHQLATPSQRMRVLKVWIMFRNIWPDWTLLPEIFQKNLMPVCIVLGRYDSIIPKKKFESSIKKWKFVEWVTLDAGHSGLIEKFASEIRNQRFQLR